MTEREILCQKLLKTHTLYNRCEQLRKDLDSVDQNAAQRDINISREAQVRRSKIVLDCKKEVAKRPRLPDSTYEMPNEPQQKPKITSQMQIMACGVGGLLIYAFAIFYAIFYILNLVDGGAGTYFTPLRVFLVLTIIGLVLWGFIGKHGAYNSVYFYQKEKYDIEMELWESQFNEAASYVKGEGFVNDFRKFDESFIAFTKRVNEKIKASEARHKDDINASQQSREETRRRLKAEYESAQRELASINVIVPEYYQYAVRIRGVLQGGRADTVKEALNIVLNDVRMEKEEQRRREEASRREELLRQQAQAAREQAEATKAQTENIRKRSVCKAASYCTKDCTYCTRIKY